MPDSAIVLDPGSRTPIRVFDNGDGSFALAVRRRRLALSVTASGESVFANGYAAEVNDEQGQVITSGAGHNRAPVTVRRGDPIYVYAS